MHMVIPPGCPTMSYFTLSCSKSGCICTAVAACSADIPKPSCAFVYVRVSVFVCVFVCMYVCMCVCGCVGVCVPGTLYVPATNTPGRAPAETARRGYPSHTAPGSPSIRAWLGRLIITPFESLAITLNPRLLSQHASDDTHGKFFLPALPCVQEEEEEEEVEVEESLR